MGENNETKGNVFGLKKIDQLILGYNNPEFMDETKKMNNHFQRLFRGSEKRLKTRKMG